MNWGVLHRELIKSPSTLARSEAEIATQAKVDKAEVMLDVPKPPKFLMPRQPLIRLWNHRVVSLSDVFPVLGWETAHETYLSVSYVMTTDISARRAIAEATQVWLSQRAPPIRVKEDAFRQAKL